MLVLLALLDRFLIGVLNGRVKGTWWRGVDVTWLLGLDDVFHPSDAGSGAEIKVVP